MKSATIFLMKFTLSFLFIICIISNQRINAQQFVSDDMSMFLSYGSLYNFKYSPNGKILATTGSAGLLLWDMENHKLINNIVDTTDINCIDWGPDNRRIALLKGNDHIKIIDIYTCEVLNEISTNISYFPWFDLSPDGTKLLTSERDTILVFDISTKEKIIKLHSEFWYKYGLWSPDGKKFAFISGNHDSIKEEYVEIYDIQTGNGVISQEIRKGDIEILTWCPDNKSIIIDNENYLLIWDSEKGKYFDEINIGYRSNYNYISISPDGKYLANGFIRGNIINLYSTTNWTPIKTICIDYCGNIRWDNNSSKITYSNINNSIIIRDVNSGLVVDSIEKYNNINYVLKWNPKYDMILSYQEYAEDNLNVQIWDSDNGTIIREKRLEDFLLWELSWSPDGSMIAHGIRDTGGGRWVIICDTSFNNINYINMWENKYISTVSWSPDGKQIATAGNRNKIPFIYDSNFISLAYFNNDAPYLNSGLIDNEIVSVSWSPDGSKIACQDKKLRIFDSKTLDEIYSIRIFEDYRYIPIIWDIEGKNLISRNYPDTLLILNVDTWQFIKKIIPDCYKFNSISLSPNGKFLAVGTGNGKIYFYDIQNWTIIKKLYSYPLEISFLNWSPDSKKLVSCQEGCIRIWEPKITDVVDKAVTNNLKLLITPNPISSSLSINYNVPSYSFIKLSVFDILGKEVNAIINEYQTEGNKESTFDVSTLPDGIYFIRLQVGTEQITEKFVKLK